MGEKKFRLPGIPLSWAILISVVVIAIGLSFIEIKQHQEQTNDQSQTVTQNAITKTVVVNIVEKNKKIKGFNWEYLTFNVKEHNEFWDKFCGLESWQQIYSKFSASGEGSAMEFHLIYPISEQQETTFTNKTITTNRSSTITTNSAQIENKLFKYIKGWFK